MSYGVKIYNPSSGELTVHSEGIGLCCIGKCTLQGSVVQPSGTIGSFPGKKAGYSRYRITSVNAPVFALDLPLNKYVGVRNVTYIGSNVWEIEVHCGDGNDGNGFHTTEYQLDVWAYAQPSATPTGWGLILRTAAGALSYDFGAGVPLAAVGYVSGTGAVPANFTIASLTRYAVLSWTPTLVTRESFRGSNTWWDTVSRGAWVRTSSTNLGKAEYVDQIYSTASPIGSPPGLDGGDVYDQPGFIIEASVLP